MRVRPIRCTGCGTIVADPDADCVYCGENVDQIVSGVYVDVRPGKAARWMGSFV